MELQPLIGFNTPMNFPIRPVQAQALAQTKSQTKAQPWP